MLQLKQLKKRWQKRLFLQLYLLSACNISTACEDFGMSRTQFYRWMRDEEFRDAIEDIDEYLLDLAEAGLINHIEKENIAAVIFFLKTKGRSRGYSERREVIQTERESLEGLTFNQLVEIKKKGVAKRLQERK